MSNKKIIQDNLAMLTYLMDNCSEPMYKNGKLINGRWVCDMATNAVSLNREAIGIEISPDNVATTKKRLEDE